MDPATLGIACVALIGTAIAFDGDVVKCYPPMPYSNVLELGFDPAQITFYPKGTREFDQAWIARIDNLPGGLGAE